MGKIKNTLILHQFHWTSSLSALTEVQYNIANVLPLLYLSTDSAHLPIGLHVANSLPSIIDSLAGCHKHSSLFSFSPSHLHLTASGFQQFLSICTILLPWWYRVVLATCRARRSCKAREMMKINFHRSPIGIIRSTIPSTYLFVYSWHPRAMTPRGTPTTLILLQLKCSLSLNDDDGPTTGENQIIPYLCSTNGFNCKNYNLIIWQVSQSNSPPLVQSRVICNSFERVKRQILN